MGGKPYHYVGIKLKLKILRIEIHDMSYGDCYVFDLVDNIGKSLFHPLEYPPVDIQVIYYPFLRDILYC